MKTRLLLVLFAGVLIGFYGCSGNQKKKNKADNQKGAIFIGEDKQIYLKKGKDIENATLKVFQKHLKSAIKSGGIDTALNYCYKKAMFLTDSMSHVKGVRIRRLAEKNRNPFNFLDEQSSKIYKKYKEEMRSGKLPKPVVVFNKKGNAVYYAPIKLGKDVCLKCHGTPGKEIPRHRMGIIKKYYPEDKAVNFKKGDLRGMWVIKFPKDKKQ